MDGIRVRYRMVDEGLKRPIEDRIRLGRGTVAHCTIIHFSVGK